MLFLSQAYNFYNAKYHIYRANIASALQYAPLSTTGATGKQPSNGSYYYYILIGSKVFVNFVDYFGVTHCSTIFSIEQNLLVVFIIVVGVMKTGNIVPRIVPSLRSTRLWRGNQLP